MPSDDEKQNRSISTRQVASYLGHVTRNIKYCNDVLSSSTPSIANLQFRKENLTKVWDKYSNIFYEYEEQMSAEGSEYVAVSKTYIHLLVYF